MSSWIATEDNFNPAGLHEGQWRLLVISLFRSQIPILSVSSVYYDIIALLYCILPWKSLSNLLLVQVVSGWLPMFNLPFLQGRRSWLQPSLPSFLSPGLHFLLFAELFSFPNLVFQAFFLFSSSNPILTAEFFHTCCLITPSSTQFRRFSMGRKTQICAVNKAWLLRMPTFIFPKSWMDVRKMSGLWHIRPDLRNILFIFKTRCLIIYSFNQQEVHSFHKRVRFDFRCRLVHL